MLDEWRKHCGGSNHSRLIVVNFFLGAKAAATAALNVVGCEKNFLSLQCKQKDKDMIITTEILKDWYTKYNAEAFNNDLPSVRSGKIVFKIVHSRHMLGQHRPMEYYHQIKVTDYYDFTESWYRKILLHEMCHLWCHVMGWPYEHHGWRWKNKAAIVGRMYGYDITRTENIQGVNVRDCFVAKETERKVKKLTSTKFLVVMDYPDHEWVVKVSPNTLKKSTDYTGNRLGKEVAKPYRIWKITNEIPLFGHMSESRSLWRGYQVSYANFEKLYKPKLENCEEVTDNIRKAWMWM